MRRNGTAIAIATVGSLPASLAGAQATEPTGIEHLRPRVAFVQSFSSDDLFGDQPGLAVAFTVPTRWGFDVRFGGERIAGRRDTIDVVCAGLAHPDCAPEPARHDLGLVAFTLGASKTVYAGRRLSVGIVPAYRLGSASLGIRGHETGKKIGGSSTLHGFEIGAEFDVAPVRRWPIAISVAPRVATFPARESTIVDGFEPFIEGFTLGRVELGVVWRTGR